MRVIRWKNSATGVESLNITTTGIYFPVGKTDSSFKLKLSMAAGGQTASVDTVRDSSGSRTGYGAMNVSGTTEVRLGAVVSFATGIIVTAISGTLNAILDDEIPITNFPEMGLGRFPTKEDADAYVYGATVPLGLPATIAGVPSVYQPGVGWVVQYTSTDQDHMLNYLRAAVTKAVNGLSDFRAVCQGDSISQGWSLTTKTHYSARLAERIARGLGLTVGSPYAFLRSPTSYTPQNDDVTIAVGAGWGNASWHSPLYGVTAGANAPVGTATSIDVTFAETIDSVNVMWNSSTATGDLVYSWNGGSKTTIARPSTTSLARVAITNIPAPSRGVHTLNLWQPATGSFRTNYFAVEPQDSTVRKVRILSTGLSGSCISALAPNFADAAASNDLPADTISKIGANLLIVEIGTNDQKKNSGWSTPEAYRSLLKQIIDGQRLRSKKLDIACIGLYDHGSSDVPGQYPITDYNAQIKGVCIDASCTFIDMQSRWIDYAHTSANGYLFDALHPGVTGSADIGFAIHKAIS